MHERDEDLLSGERARTGQRLAGLPELEPPERARTFVLAAMREAAIARQSFFSRHRLAVAAAVAAIVLGAAALLGAMLFAGFTWVDRASSSATARSAPADDATNSRVALLEPTGTAEYGDLIEASRELEQLLIRLPAQRQLMSVGTASTIAGLENQIAFIDEHLMLATRDRVEPQVQQALWQERVEAMNALVQIRYAQSRLFTY